MRNLFSCCPTVLREIGFEVIVSFSHMTWMPSQAKPNQAQPSPAQPAPRRMPSQPSSVRLATSAASARVGRGLMDEGLGLRPHRGGCRHSRPAPGWRRRWPPPAWGAAPPPWCPPPAPLSPACRPGLRAPAALSAGSTRADSVPASASGGTRADLKASKHRWRQGDPLGEGAGKQCLRRRQELRLQPLALSHKQCFAK